MNTSRHVTLETPPSPANTDRDNSLGERLFDWFAKARSYLFAGFTLLIAGLLYQALRHLGQELSYAQIVVAMHDTTSIQHLLACGATLLSYLALTGYDWSSLRYVGASVPYRIVAQTSFIAFALGNTIGVGVLTGGAVRMRIFGAAGVDAGAISRAIAFNAVAFGCGLCTVGALAVLWDPAAVAAIAGVPTPIAQGFAMLLLGAVAVFLWRCRDPRAPRLFGITIALPSFRLATTQLAISIADMVAATLVLWALLPLSIAELPALIAWFSIATVLGVISHLPGGLGVFEAVLMFSLRDRLPIDQIASALVLYRLYYHVLPLAAAVAQLLLAELRRGVAAPVHRAMVAIAPQLLAGYTLLLGVVLLISGMTPTSDEITDLLAMHVPLPLVEGAHFLGSVGGLALLIIARGMSQRLDATWWAGMGVSLLALITTLPKGIALPEAGMLLLLFITLALARSQFTRRAALLAQPFSGGWLLSVIGILAAIAAILFFVYQDTEYTHELWWQFEFDAHAPRSLRAFVAVAVLAFGFALRAALRPPRPRLIPPDAVTLARVERIVRGQAETGACLAMTADKHILFSASGQAFIMFGRRGGSWICLFDPVGPQAEWGDLIWRFMERAREAGGRASFYQIRPRALPLYLDAGLRLFKLGEEASVPLADFSLHGKARGNLRHSVSRAERQGLTFTLEPVERVPVLLPELRRISDAWLDEHHSAEKGFSLGAFDDAYLRRFPIAVVRSDETMIAFATVLLTDQQAEVSVDLMRHVADPPPGTMDFLFARLMSHCRDLGYQRFALGMAPLSGLAEHPLAPRWHRIGRLLYAHGEHFYNFRGLRAFKQKFDPEWEARYLASPGGTVPLLVLADVAALIGGGLRGVFTK